jgi:hypothetical protein
VFFVVAGAFGSSCATAPGVAEPGQHGVDQQRNECFQAFIELRRYKTEWGRQLAERHHVSAQECLETFPTARADAPTASPSCEGLRLKDLPEKMRVDVAEMNADINGKGSSVRPFAPDDSVSWIFVAERDDTLKAFERDCSR